jgi:hypothetical protein
MPAKKSPLTTVIVAIIVELVKIVQEAGGKRTSLDRSRANWCGVACRTHDRGFDSEVCAESSIALRVLVGSERLGGSRLFARALFTLAINQLPKCEPFRALS